MIESTRGATRAGRAPGRYGIETDRDPGVAISDHRFGLERLIAVLGEFKQRPSGGNSRDRKHATIVRESMGPPDNLHADTGDRPDIGRDFGNSAAQGKGPWKADIDLHCARHTLIGGLQIDGTVAEYRDETSGRYARAWSRCGR